MEIKISPNKLHTTKFWKSLNLIDSTSDWEIAIKIFKERIEGRFLLPIKAIETHHNKEVRVFSGFAIMAIDCLLIETLNQFYHGINETNDNYKGCNAKAFCDFFNGSSHFNKYLDTLEKSTIFYKQIRCGILHQAQTKSSSTIISSDKKPLIQWINPKNLKEGIIVNRLKFHAALVSELYDYLEKLKEPTNKVLRTNFVIKMNFISDTSS